MGRIRLRGRTICTGTLIGLRTVLTAAHCLIGPAEDYEFFVGGRAFAVRERVAYPGYWPDADDGRGFGDLGILLLDEAPEVKPSPISTVRPWVGQAITLVGFGVTGEDRYDAGVKRIGTNEISEVTSDRFEFELDSDEEASTCYGDSGGPAFARLGTREAIIGVTSGGEVPCGWGSSWDTRVDAFVSWITRTAERDVRLASG